MRIFYDNLIDYAGVVFTPSSEVSTLPATNLADARKGKVWKCGTTLTTEFVVFDFGSAKEAMAFIGFNHNFVITGSGPHVFQGNNSDSWGGPSFQTQGYSAEGYVQMLLTQGGGYPSYRYWRWALVKDSSSASYQAGRAFIGPYVTIAEQCDFSGLDEDNKEMTINHRARGGQTFSDIGDPYRVITGSYSYLSQASSDSIRTLYAAVGTHTPFFIEVNEADSNSLITGETLYVKFASPPKLSISHYDGTEYKWDTKLVFEEQL